MKSNAIWLVVLGIGISIVAQYIGISATTSFKFPDPAFALFYSSIGLLVSLLVGFYSAYKKQWSIIAGLGIGILLWWPFVGVIMTVMGRWF